MVFKLRSELLTATRRQCYKELQASISTILNLTEDLWPLCHPPCFEAIKEVCILCHQESLQWNKQRLQKKMTNMLRRQRPRLPPKSEPTPSNLLTDLSNSITQEESALLTLGPKFSLPPKSVETCLHDCRVALNRLSYQVSWKAARSSEVTTPLFSAPPGSGEFYTPPTGPDISTVLSSAFSVIASKARLPHKQLSPGFFNQISALKKRDLIFLPSDKGGEFCVIQKVRYISAVESHLANHSIYHRVLWYNPADSEFQLNSKWSSIGTRYNLPPYIIRRFKSNHSTVARFYGFIKTHKGLEDIQIRPIVNTRDSPTFKLSWLLHKIISPLLTIVPSHIASSVELLHRIQESTDDVHHYPCSLDVEAMFTSIPVEEAIRNVEELFLSNKTVPQFFRTSDISTLLRAVFAENIFSFNSKVYRQVKGLPMGNRLSGTLACLFLHRLEQQVIHSLPIKVYARYVDDIFILTKSEEDAISIHHTFNSLHSSLTFTLEKPSSQKLELLDLGIKWNRDSETFQFSFFKKASRSDVLLNANSHLPISTKRNFVRNEFQRVEDRCSSQSSLRTAKSELSRRLRINGYSDAFISQNSKATRTTAATSPEPFFLTIPFLGEAVDSGLKRLFSKSGLNVRISHRSRTLRNVLANQPPVKSKTCTIKNCPLRSSGLCFRKMVIYYISCDMCGANYVGSTIRFLHVRIREHLTVRSSPVFRHSILCPGQFKTSVLRSAKDPVDLRFSEALEIRSRCPSLNTQEDTRCLVV